VRKIKQRILTGVVGIAFFVIVLFFSDTLILSAAVGILGVIAIWEIFSALKCTDHLALLVSSGVFALAVPFFKTPYWDLPAQVVCFAYLLCVVIIMLVEKYDLELRQVAVVFMITLIVPFSLSSLIYIEGLQRSGAVRWAGYDGAFVIALAAIGAWGSDGGAYFIGVFFGKHKLAPSISPHKTWEGAVGGFVCCIALSLLAAYLYGTFALPAGARINLFAVLGLAVLAPFAAVAGDLWMSLIKRENQIKDFGNIIPGHGGVLDRFDSFMLVAPLTYLYVLTTAPYFPLISR